MADTIDPLTGKVVLNLVTRTHVNRIVLQSLLSVMIRNNPKLAEMMLQDLEKRKDAAQQPELREYIELAIGEVLSASVASRVK
jgi:flagellar motor component MotA